MKKHILFIGILMMVFGLKMNAQTLKNIHRHNQPVLQIPIDLIDKVETVDVAGQKYLHVTQFNGFVNQVPVSQIDSITHSEGQALDPAQLGNLRTASVMGVVSGPTGAPEMNAIVRSPYGGEETRTDPNGVFFLNDIVVYDKLGYITITKPGFHQASRSFLPLETGSNRVNVQLLQMTQSGTFSASSGGTVTSGLLQLSFPANAVTLNGQPYSGTVNVYASALDPSSPEMYDQMPGELLGGMNDSLRLLRSFGMASVELRDANMNELQLAQGASATLTFNIPSALQADAPEAIDWWSFDEALGYWKHEGEAQKLDDQYIGLASHFSWWNVDVPENFNDLFGHVQNSTSSSISNAQIRLISPTMGTGITFTNTLGDFSGRVPKNQDLQINIYLVCPTTNSWSSALSEQLASGNAEINSVFTADLNDFYLISGNVVNCEGNPVQSSYVKIDSQIFLCDQDSFQIAVCSTGELSIRAYDTSNPEFVKVGESTAVNVFVNGTQVGSLEACSPEYSVLSDIDGNDYLSVLIGSQWWMAENLRVSHFNDGTLIPNVTDDEEWIALNIPAWCNYENIQVNENVYGKMYNWLAVNDARGLCPIGWHEPSDEEFNTLVDLLGGGAIAGGKLKLSGSQYWVNPNTDATNESGFSALPGGSRNASNGAFATIGTRGNFWSSSESAETAWTRILANNSAIVSRLNYSKLLGLSVRCIKD